MPASSARLAVPKPAGRLLVPGYDLVGELGRGGMGVVYRAVQLSLKRPVALKMIPPGLDVSDEDLARFRLEAESAARVQHPNVVQVFEIGQHQGRLWFAMEFVPGGSLFDQLRAGPLPPREAARVVEGAARGVHAAHLAGIVHRDLKPGNVLLTLPAAGERLGMPKITDFGLARQGGRGDLTTTDAVLGTPAYMAPEQARGLSRDVGPAADVYALGAILYECLAGRPPFRSESPTDLLDMVRFQDPLPPGRLNPSVPPELDAVCLRCLAKDPSGRYRSAGALADDLRRCLGGEPPREASPAAAAVFATLPSSGGALAGPGRALPLGYRVVAEQARDDRRAAYQAWQAVPGRNVRLAVRAHRLPPDDPKLVKWRSAAGVLSRLAHPHLPRVWQWGEERGLCFVAEEWLDCGTLADRLDGSPWDARSAAEVVLSLARALALTQPHGLVHGRLNPARVRLCGGGEHAVPKLRGFAALRPGAGPDAPGRWSAYTAPEVARGDEPGPAADVYSLGVLLFELFSGKPPGAAAAPRAVPAELKGLVLLCLQTRPERRIATAAALADDMCRALECFC